VGRIALASPEVDGALITFHLLRVRTDSRVSLATFLYLALRGAPEVRAAIDDVAVGATRAGFNTRLLEDLWIPLPSLVEQGEIERRANAALLGVDDLGKRLLSIGVRAAQLEQAALAKAFRGELVPQDPTDEPASVLLDRIRAARAAEPERSRRRRAETSPPNPLSLKGEGGPKSTGSAPLSLQGEGSTRSVGGEVSSASPEDLVVAVLLSAGRASASTIDESTGLGAVVVKKALKALVDGGQVRVEGKARGTAYVWAGSR
jgi:hypothetical protein